MHRCVKCASGAPFLLEELRNEILLPKLSQLIVGAIVGAVMGAIARREPAMVEIH